MFPYYQFALYASITLSGLFLWKWNRHISASFTIIYLLLPFINIGYLRVAVADNISDAILANGLVYLCSCFLQFGYMAFVFSFCKLKLPKPLAAVLFSLNGLIGSMALTTLQNKALYTSAELVLDEQLGTKYIEKTYGPLHNVYIVLLLFYFVTELAALVYGFRRRDVSKKTLLIIFSIYLVNFVSFVGTRLSGLHLELQPAAYILSQCVLLYMSIKLKIYSVDDTAANSIIEEGKTGFVSFDLSKHYLGSSGHALEYLPELRELYIDGPLYENKPEFDYIRELIAKVEASGQPAETDIKRGDIYIHITANYIYMKKKAVCFQLRTEDKTKEQEYITLLENARRMAEDTSKAKGDFLANMSHEIRTPINAILGMDEMILRESAEKQTIKYAENIQQAGNTLLGLINDVLDFSKIEAGKTEIIPVDYQLSSVLNDLYNMMHPKASEKMLDFVFRIDPDIPDYLRGDEIRLKQIIMNLLTNAVKYTQKGTVTLSAGFTRTGNGAVDLKISVEDTGIGIKKEDIDKLYVAFERIDENCNRSVEGTGLGLNITSRLLQLMDSRLEVESEYGKGSVFSFILRQEIIKDMPIGSLQSSFERAEAERTHYHESFRAPEAVILVVDDIEMNLAVFGSLLKRTGIKINTARDGFTAAELARHTRYDVIFLDHRMPNKDGIETLNDIRADEQGLNRDTPAVCLTANAVSGVREKYIAAGFCEYLTKPIDPDKLEKTLKGLLPPEKIGEPSPTAADSEEQPDGGEDIRNIYLNSIDEMSELIETLYKNEDWENYTIKVHALKSTSKLVGENEISELAAELEKAGDRGDIETIRANTDRLLRMYRAVKEKYGVSPAADDSELPEASEEYMEEAYDAMRGAADSFDYDMLCGILDELEGFRIPEEHSDRIHRIKTAADNVDWGSLKNLIPDRDNM